MKKKLRLILLFLLLLLIVFVVLLFNNKQNVNIIYPSVVHIECKNEKTTAVGSGIVYNIKEGNQYIVTNYHIIKGYSQIYVYDQELNFEKAKLLNYDEDSDIAILIIKNSLNTKKAIFDEKAKLEKNEEVYILTSDIGNNKTYIIKDAIVESTKENIVLNDKTKNCIKLSYDIESGDSGSPVINKKGKVVGMIFLKDTSILHYGYAIPVSYVLKEIDNLKLKRNRINVGAMFTNSTNIELLNEYNISINNIEGVVILSLINGYPLYNAGLQKGDVITKFNNVEIINVNTLKEEIKKLNKNDIVNIEYYRNNNLTKTIIKLDS